MQITSSTTKRLQKTYHLAINPSISPLRNAINIHLHTILQKHNTQPLDSTLYDLTSQQLVPTLAKNILGLGMKFIPTPMTTTNDISTNMARLERDIHLKVFFAGHDTDTSLDTTPKLYVKSNWNPPPNEIPPWVDARFN
jgi:hypothetical protein